ncbi:MAG: hypothetical protein LBD20_02615 [Spirochaetaceae bacterium]|jgi:phage tail sheath gpL-like|nr:hypothetical protein [Spirochaetaceae bacterium]
MANILPNSQAFGVGVAVNNTPLSTVASVKKRKLLFIATALNIGALRDTPIHVLSPADAADKFGLGSTAHRMALAAWRGHGGQVPTYIIISDITDGAAATASISVTAQAQHKSGAIALYIMGKKYTVIVGVTDNAEVIASHIADTINTDASLPFIAAPDETDTSMVNLTARENGVYGNDILIEINVHPELGDALPFGVTLTNTSFSGGAGLPNIADVLTALGTGDQQNKLDFTAVGHVYGYETTILDALSEYNGLGNEMTGDYSQIVARPFRSAVCDTVRKGSAGMGELIEFGNTRAVDRTTGLISCPFTLSNSHEVAAEFLGKAEAYNASQAGGSLAGLILSGVDASLDNDDNFTTEYTNRDQLLAAGITPLIVEDGVTQTTNTITSYHSSAISPENNAYRRFVDISKTQNVLFNVKRTFSSAKWRGFIVVEDAGTVGRPDVRARCRDRIAVIGELMMLIDQFYDMGVLFSKTPSVESLKNPQNVQLRPDGGGFNINLDMQYSGEGGIISAVINIDTAVSA